MLFEMVAGQPPFRRENEYATMYAHTTEPPPALSSLAQGVPPALDAALARALAKHPDERFPSAGDFARAVAAAVAGEKPSEPERNVAVGRAAPAASAVAPASEMQPEPQPHPVYGYGLDPGQVDGPPSYPTAALPPRRRPWLPLLAVLAVLLAAGGVAAAVLLTGTDQTVTVQAPPAQPPAQGGPSIQDGVNQIAAILDLSA
jgi:serine/threonine-protein kinase